MGIKFKPIKLNDKGMIIRHICAMLKKHGSAIKPTMTFHIGMRSAVLSFQKKHGLPATGIIDKKTFDKLEADPPKARKVSKK